MAQPNESSTQIVNKMLKIDGRGWNIALFEDANKVSICLCVHCGAVVCDAVELGCDHNEDDEIFLYCKICLAELVKDNGNKCMISGHYNPPLDVARSIRRQISKAIVVCPYSSVFKIRNNSKKNKHDNAQILDTLGYDEKEGSGQRVAAAPAKSEQICKWKGTLSELKSKHITECAQKNDPTFALNITIKKLQNENQKLKNTIKNKDIEINRINNQINEQFLMVKDVIQSNDEKNKVIHSLKQQIESYEQKQEHKAPEKKTITSLREVAIFPFVHCLIDFHNSIFTTEGTDTVTSTFVIIQRRWSKDSNNGIHKIKFKCLQSAGNDISIGICTRPKVNPTKCTAWFFDSKESGTSYQLYVHDNDTKSTGIYHHKNGKKKYQQIIANRKPISDNKLTHSCYAPNETMGMQVDFNKLQVKFYINSKQFGKTVKIESNVYYPAISYGVINSCFSKYGILRVQFLCID